MGPLLHQYAPKAAAGAMDLRTSAPQSPGGPIVDRSSWTRPTLCGRGTAGEATTSKVAMRSTASSFRYWFNYLFWFTLLASPCRATTMLRYSPINQMWMFVTAIDVLPTRLSAPPRFGQGRQRARRRGSGQGKTQEVQHMQWRAMSDLSSVARAAMERVGGPEQQQ